MGPVLQATSHGLGEGKSDTHAEQATTVRASPGAAPGLSLRPVSPRPRSVAWSQYLTFWEDQRPGAWLTCPASLTHRRSVSAS